MAEFKDRLEQALKMRNMKPADLAKITGINEGAISQYRKGSYKATQRNLEKMSRALNVSIAWLMGSDDDTFSSPLPVNIIPIPKMKKVPLIGTIACGQPILAVEDATEFVTAPETLDIDFALECKGDSMINARIFPGDIVYIKKQPVVENGEIAAVLIGEEATLKKVYYTPGTDRIVLQACNPMYADMVYSGEQLNEIKILGKAVWFMSKVRT